MMKPIFLSLLLLLSCTPELKDDSAKAKQEILAADQAMNTLASEKGFHFALLQFADEQVVKPNEGELPIIGKQALKLKWDAEKDMNNITWQPKSAEASKSGDLGYSYGNWQFKLPDTVLCGFYYTIWKKQTDNTWKFVMDGGNNTPKPF